MKTNYSFYEPGVWLVKPETEDGITYLKATLYEELNDDPIKPYPFVNVEKYRDVIESTLQQAFAVQYVNVENVATQVIRAISEKIQYEKDNQPLTKEDLLNNVVLQ